MAVAMQMRERSLGHSVFLKRKKIESPSHYVNGKILEEACFYPRMNRPREGPGLSVSDSRGAASCVVPSPQKYTVRIGLFQLAALRSHAEDLNHPLGNAVMTSEKWSIEESSGSKAPHGS